jgi:CO dehydrogenase/acetyl-CoA synthase gamma subunit (corrinoid Fe-S protein)
LAFALKLINDEMQIPQCPLLYQVEFEKNRIKLEELLSDS